MTLVSLGFAQSPNEGSTDSNAQYHVFNERIRVLSSERGRHAIDCATTLAKFGTVDECARKRLEKGKPFFLGYPNPPNTRFVFAYGLAADADRNVFMISYQERGFPPVALNRHMRLMDDNHTRVTECIKPIKLVATEQGWLVCVTPIDEQASALAATERPIDTSVCAVLDDPPAFNNRLVRIHAYYRGNMEDSTLHDDRCQGALWFGFPSGGQLSAAATYVSPGPVQGSEDESGKRILPVPVSLVRDANLDHFEKLVRLNPERGVPLVGEPVQHVFATFIGRIDAVSPEIHEFLKKQSGTNKWSPLGFGHLGGCEAELILQSIEDEPTIQ